MIRTLLSFASVLPFASFVSPDPIVGKWMACEHVKLGATVTLKKWSSPPCSSSTYNYTEMTFDTIRGGRVVICTGGATDLAGGAACYEAKWSYDPSKSMLSIRTDSLVVGYLVTISDSSLTLTTQVIMR